MSTASRITYLNPYYSTRYGCRCTTVNENYEKSAIASAGIPFRDLRASAADDSNPMKFNFPSEREFWCECSRGTNPDQGQIESAAVPGQGLRDYIAGSDQGQSKFAARPDQGQIES